MSLGAIFISKSTIPFTFVSTLCNWNSACHLWISLKGTAECGSHYYSHLFLMIVPVTWSFAFILYELCKKLHRAFSQQTFWHALGKPQEGLTALIMAAVYLGFGIVYAGLLAWLTGKPQKNWAIIHFMNYSCASPAITSLNVLRERGLFSSPCELSRCVFNIFKM